MNKLQLTILAVIASIFANNASAFDPDDLQKLKDTLSCVQCNLRDADLIGVDLRGATLDRADLSNANLKDAMLGGAIMRGVILCNTTMPDGSVTYSGC